MASQQEQAQERSKQSLQMKMRRALDDAYGALEGQKCIQTFSAFSFEEALDNQIERIAGASTRLRPNELDRVARTKSSVLEAVDAIKQVPPEAFMSEVPSRDVNT